MATVKMKKGDKYADVHDSPETIRQAQLDGYSIVEKQKTEQTKTAEKKDSADKTVKR